MKHLFTKLAPDTHGVGRVLFAWSPDGSYLAVAGVKARRRTSAQPPAPARARPHAPATARGLPCRLRARSAR